MIICYINYKWATERKVDDNNEGYDYPVIRYAEVLLNYAEAMYEKDGSISDADLDISLNVVRARSNPEMTKLSNVEGRISYITSEKKQEFLYAAYDTEDGSFWGELAECCQTEFKKNGTNGKCIEARELVIALPEEFINIKPDELLEFFVEQFRETVPLYMVKNQVRPGSQSAS